MKRTLRSLWLGALALAASSQMAMAAPKPVVPHQAKPAFPTLNLTDRHSHGQRAVDLLRDRLPEVAAYYRKSPDEFRNLLLKDRRVKLDQRGRMFVVEELDVPLSANLAPASLPGLVDGALQPLDQTFLLHSRPGAARTIHLNFKGATLTGTAWNSSSATITALPFDLDGAPYTFSAAELERIQGIWQRVAEDYAPFNVNVTTEAPTADKITRSGSTDTVFGTVALITSSVGVYDCSCGGVAYVGVYDDTNNYYKPALVFYDKLGSGNEKYIAEAVSHELGHNMGLSHDGTSALGYYTGHGTGLATAWAPIMGVGYQKPLVQFSKGEYADANNKQDDFAIMQSNGLPLRTDDHGDTQGTATALVGTLSGGVTTARASGVIERATDIDAFTFAAEAGPVTFTLSPAARSANLDGWLTLHDGAGNVITSANPLDALGASFTTTLAAPGSYFVSVRGTGEGVPLNTGYSTYGSLGQYDLVGSYTASTNVPPQAVITAPTLTGTAPLTVSFSGASSTDSDGNIASWNWTFGDGGTGSGGAVNHVYSTPGSYTATLRVVDNGGMSAAASATVTVGTPLVAMSVNDIAMSRTLTSTRSRATAVVKVLNSAGQPVSGVSVSARWSGATSATVSGTTGTAGTVSFSSAQTTARTGSFTFTVTAASKTGHSYVPASNVETSDSITVR